MAADPDGSRETLTRQAEKHLRQGRTDLALDVYERLVALSPIDWNTVKQLADLLERAGHREAAAERFLQCASYHFEQGFHPKAAALFRKVLKLHPQHETALRLLGEVSLALKLKADARVAFGEVLRLCTRRGDQAGASEMAARLAALEPEESRIRLQDSALARVDVPDEPPSAPWEEDVPGPAADDVTGTVVEETPVTDVSADAAPGADPPLSPVSPVDLLRRLARDAEASGDAEGSMRAWSTVLHQEPHDADLRRRLVQAAIDRHDSEGASGLVGDLGRDTLDDLALHVQTLHLASQTQALYDLATLVVRRTDDGDRMLICLYDRLWQRTTSLGDVWLSMVLDALVDQGEVPAAADVIDQACALHPQTVECHLRWVELCVDADLPSLDRAQQALAEAYRHHGQVDLADAVDQDLQRRHPRDDQESAEVEAHEAVEASPTVPSVPVDAGVPATQFDWAGLLGREIGAGDADDIGHEPPASAVSSPREDPTPSLEPVLAPLTLEVGDDTPFGAEVDLTELVDALRAASAPSPAEGGDELAPAGDDPRRLAEQQVAAGRVFAAAGLAAEAARAFERGASDRHTRFEATVALAQLHASRGHLVEAARWYEEAALAPVPDAALRRPVLYDLAETLEAVGQPERALGVLLDLLSEVDEYQDARARVDRLLRVDAGG